MFDTFKPLGNRLVAKITVAETMTAGGIYIPSTAEKEINTGSVLSVGPGRKTDDGKIIPMDIKVGDTVFFNKYAGVKVGTEHLILREDEVMGLL